MLQSIQYIGSGSPTYIYSNEAVGASGEYYHVFAAETRGYDSRRERKEREESLFEKTLEKESDDLEEFKMINNSKSQNLQDIYQKEYGRRESFLWKLR